MAGWVLTTMMVVTAATHQGTGYGQSASTSSASHSNTQDGFPDAAACHREGERWRADILARHPTAKATYTCHPPS